MAVTIPSWLAWMLSAFVLNESYGPPCFGFGLIGICMLTFIIMFVPKSRQLSAIGKLQAYSQGKKDTNPYKISTIEMGSL